MLQDFRIYRLISRLAFTNLRSAVSAPSFGLVAFSFLTRTDYSSFHPPGLDSLYVFSPIFAILFLLVFCGFIAVSVISLRAYSISNVSGGIGGGAADGLGSTLNQHTAILLMLSSAVGLVFSLVYLLLVKTFTKIILEVTLALSVLLNIGYCVYLWVEGFTSAAIIFTIFAVFSIIAYFFMRKRIPFAKVMLQTIIRAANEYKSVYVIALMGLIVQTAFSVWFAWTLVAVYQRFEPGTSASGSSSSSGAVTGLVVFCIVSFESATGKMSSLRTYSLLMIF